MITNDSFRKLAMSFPETVELPHFENASFRVKKKIFATLNPQERRGCLKLSEADQSLFCSYDKTVIYPVPNKWGKQGWTLVSLAKIKKALLHDVLTCAFLNVAPKKVADKFREEHGHPNEA